MVIMVPKTTQNNKHLHSLHWRPTCYSAMENPGESLGQTTEKRILYFSARRVNPEKPPGETMESPLEYPQPPLDGHQHGLPRRAGTDPDGDRWNWRIRWRKTS